MKIVSIVLSLVLGFHAASASTAIAVTPSECEAPSAVTLELSDFQNAPPEIRKVLQSGRLSAVATRVGDVRNCLYWNMVDYVNYSEGIQFSLIPHENSLPNRIELSVRLKNDFPGK